MSRYSSRTAALTVLAAVLCLGPSAKAADNTGTGGTITYTDSGGANPRSSPPYTGGYVVHTFTSSGTLTIPAAATGSALVVAGGGAGGPNGGGGGGAGGVLTSSSVSLTTGGMTVTVGAGGVPNTYTTGWTASSGANSVFGGLTATGGGGGGSRGDHSTSSIGANGGSGGGGGSKGGTTATTGGNGTSGQGSSGGNGVSPDAGAHGGGGGGGAGGAGATATGPGGNGGTGVANTISGSSVTYGGGGGGGIATPGTAGTGGSGGGGAGSQTTGANGTANTGGGGGGGGTACGSGGSGIVIVRYPYVQGTVYTFTKGSPAGTYAWTTTGNWDANGVPVSSAISTVNFFADTTTALASGTLAINTDPSALTLNTLTLNGLGAASGSPTVINIGTAGNTWTLDGTTPTINLNGLVGTMGLTTTVLPNITLNQNLTITGNGTASTLLSGNITGGFSLTKSGTATLTLGGANTFTGGLTINDNGGIVAVTSAGGLSTAAITIGSGGGNLVTGEIQLSGGITITSAGNIAFPNSRANFAGGGSAEIENLSGNNSLNSNLSINGSGGNGANILSTAGTLTLAGNLTVTSGGRTYDFSGAGNTTVSGNIVQGTGTAVQKDGTGTLTLTGSGNTYAGATTVNGGTLLVNSPGSLASGSAVTVANGATLGGSGTINGTVNVSAGGYLAPGGINTIGTLTLAANSASSLTLNGNLLSFDLPASGITCDLITISGASGALVLNGANYIQLTAPSGAATGTYTLMTYATKTGTGTLTFPNGSTTMTVGSSTLTLNVTAGGSGAGSGSVTLTITGAAVSALNSDVWSGAASYAWDTSSGNWTKNGTASSAFSASDAVVFDDTGLAASTITSGGTVSPSSLVFNNSSKSYTVSATIGGTGTPLFKNGSATSTLSGANTYSGGTTVSAGTLALSGSGTLGTTTGALTLSGGTLDLGALTTPTVGAVSISAAAGSGNTIQNGTLTGTSYAASLTTGTATITAILAGSSVPLTKSGAGTLTLSAANTYSGATAVNVGTLQLLGTASSANLSASTTVTVASGANLEFSQNNVQNQTANYNGFGLNLTGLGADNSATAGHQTVQFQGVNNNNDTFNLSGNITVASGVQFYTYGIGNIINFGGTFSGTGDMSFVDGGATGHTFIFSGNSAASGYAGNFIFYANASGSTAVTGKLSGGVNRLPTTASVNLQPASATVTASLDLNGQSQQLAGLVNNASFPTAAIVLNSGAGTPTLTINNAGADAFSGVLGTGGTGFALTKTGAGTLTLSGANTYTGDTTISAGTLALTGGGTLANTPNIIVASGAGFDVSTPTTALTLGSGQTLKASATSANTTGTITVASIKNLTLGGTTTGLAFTAYGGGSTPPLTVAGTGGALDLNGKPVTVTTTSPLAAGAYKLIAKSGSATVTGTPGTLTWNGSGSSGVVSGATPTLQVVSGELWLYVPGITAASTLSGSLASTYGTPANPESVSVSGSGLSGNLTVTAQAGYQVCLTSGGTYTSSLTLSPSSGTVSATTVYVEYTSAKAAANYDSANAVALTSTGAATVNVATTSSGNTVSALAVTLNGSKPYDGSATINAANLSIANKVGSDDVTLSGSATLSSANAGSPTISLVSGLSLGGTAAGNYTLTGYSSGTVTVSALAASVTANPQTKTYGDVNPALSAVTNGAVNGDVINVSITTDATQYSAVGQSNILVSAGTNPNYTVLTTNSTLTISAKAASVTANPQTKTYGDVNPVLTAVTNGAVNGDVINVTIVTDATQFSGVGVSNITVTANSNPNYTVLTTNSTLTISQASTFVGATSTNNPSGYRDAVAFTATLPAFASGDVVFSSTNGPISTNTVSSSSATSLSITNLPRGTNVITVAYLGDGNYVGSTNTLNQIVTNHPPVAVDATYYRAKGLSLKIAITNLLSNVTDVDGDTITLQSVGAGLTNATIMTDSTYVYYLPGTGAGSNDNDVVSYAVSDGFGGTATANILVNVYSAAGPAQMSLPTNGVVNITFFGIPNYTYVVQTTTNLSVPWWTLSTNTASTNGSWLFTDPNATNAEQYYRSAQP